MQNLSYDSWWIIILLALWILVRTNRLGKQIEGVHHSLRMILAQPIDIRQAELKEYLAAKKEEAKRHDRNNLTILLVIVAALAAGWYWATH